MVGIKMNKHSGKVFIVGSGPGDPGLLTVKALSYIRKADVIVYDRLISKDILRYRKPGCALKYVGKEKGGGLSQDKINTVLSECAKRYGAVVRLKGGDPFIFGRGPEEALFLKGRGISTEIVPGVSSFYSVPEICGIPLTHRGIASSFLVVTGHEDPSKGKSDVDWKHIAGFSGTIVILMGLTTLGGIVKKLLGYGKSKNILCAVISHGATSAQKIVTGTLADIEERSRALSSPAIIVIGDVVSVGFELNRGIKPLSKKRYLSTASRELSDEISGKLKSLGADVDCVPMIKVSPHRDRTVLDGVIKDIGKFDWLVFTSRYGAGHFLRRFKLLSGRVSDLEGRIACVGNGTADVFSKNGISPALMPENFTTKDLALALKAREIKGKRIALLRTRMKKDPLKRALMAAGAEVTDCIVYDIEENKGSGTLLKALSRGPDGIIFMSPRSTDAFFKVVPKDMINKVKKNMEFLSIGPVTTGALRRHGLSAIRSPREYTIDGLVELCAGRN
jgi:uroporphyrinogen III methyltransferase/synthase